MINTLEDYKNREYKPIDSGETLISASLAAVISKCLEVDPVKRYLAVSEVLFDLEYPEKVLPDVRFVPFIERNPILFWKMLCLFFVLCTFVLGLLQVK